MMQAEIIIQLKSSILSGKEISLGNFNLTLEDYLSKDETNESFLEFLLKNKHKLDYFEEKKIINSLEAAYLYYKYDKGLYSFKLTEEDLFTEVEPEKKFINLLIEKNAITSSLISVIENHLEIADILYNSKFKTYISSLSDKIISKLLTQDENGKFLLEKYVEDDLFVSRILESVKNPEELYNFCIKTNKKEMLKYANPEALISDIKPGKSFLEFLLENEIEPLKLIDLPTDAKFIKFLVEKEYFKYLINARETHLLTKLENQKTVVELLIEKNLLKEINSYVFSAELFKILYKHNLIHIFKGNINENLLLTKMSEISNDEEQKGILLDYLSDDVTFECSNPEIIELLFTSKKYKTLGLNIKEQDVLKSINGECILDVLLENNVDLGFIKYGIDEPEVAEKIFDKNRFDLLKHFTISLLLQEKDNKTYLEYLLNAVKNGKIELNLSKISLFSASNEEIAKFYIIIAQNNMINYVNKVDKDDLLMEQDGVKLIDELLTQNPKLAFEKIIPESVKSDVEIATYLKKYGLNQEKIDISTEKNYASKYLENRNRHYGIGPIPKEGEELLSHLEELFKNDGISEMKFINVLISGYRHALINNYNYFINELRNLVDVKEEYPEKFVYHENPTAGAFFRLNDGAIYCDVATPDTIIHETGHALHFYLGDNKVPEEYRDVIRRVRENPETIKKIKDYSDFYNDIKTELRTKLTLESEEYFKEHSKTDEEIQKIIETSIEEKKSTFSNLGISDEALESILNQEFTVEEYKAHQKRIYVEEHFDAILGNEYTAYYALCDILDAIYEGKIFSEALTVENGDTIKRIAGHGIPYYAYTEHGFDEMIANIALIAKSKDSEKALAILKDIAGEELYNMVTEFYEKNIVYGSIQRGKSR